MNQRYVSTAVIPDPGASPEIFARDPGLFLQATTRPGAKIPHVWLADRAGKKISTLDVTGRGKFTLVTGLAGTDWVTATAELAFEGLRTIVIGALATQDIYGDWQRAREIDEAGALLVRPDGMVAWRAMVAPSDAAAAKTAITAALGAILSAPVASC